MFHRVSLTDLEQADCIYVSQGHGQAKGPTCDLGGSLAQVSGRHSERTGDYQQGINPAGLARVVRCLRGWARQADDELTYQPAAEARILLSTDLESAFCRMLRSGGFAKTEAADAQLARWSAVMWRSGHTKCWQRVGDSWELDEAKVGTPQGLRSGQLSFAVEVTADVRESTQGVDVAMVGIHDDWYFELAAEDLPLLWSKLSEGMSTLNHKMSADKCSVLPLAPRGSSQYLAAEAAAKAAGVPLAAGHVDALGTALGGLREISLEADGRLRGTPQKFLAKRIIQLETDARLVTDLLELSSHTNAAQVAWALLGGATSKGLDYDLAMLPPRFTAEARQRVGAALRATVDVFRGTPLSDAEWTQARLPSWLGGGDVGIFSDTAAAARYIASWMTSGKEAQELAAELGRPLRDLPEREEAEVARQILGKAGILLTPAPCSEGVSPGPLL